MLVCPVCGCDMAVIELHGIEIDYCFSCGGIWLDAGELEYLMGDPEKSAEILKSFQDVSSTNKEKKRPCPICGKAMKKVSVPTSETEIIIDKCPKEHGIWFDKDELYRIINELGEAKNMKVAEFLKDMFQGESEKK